MFGIVINEQGYQVTFVVLDEDRTPKSYILKKGEQVIEKGWDIANSMIKPRWDSDNEMWIETATEEEIEAIRPPQIDICEPTDRERMDQLEGMVGMLAEQVARQSLGMSLI